MDKLGEFVCEHEGRLFHVGEYERLIISEMDEINPENHIRYLSGTVFLEPDAARMAKMEADAVGWGQVCTDHMDADRKG